LRGNVRPSLDEIGEVVVVNSQKATEMLKKTSGMKKTKALIMVLSATCECSNVHNIIYSDIAEKLEERLIPVTAEKCWGKGTAFSMAMESAKKLILEQIY
jgi:hypothetical protein